MEHQTGMTQRSQITQKGRIWAAVSYGSHFVGLPLGIIPLILREDPYAVHHARHAVAVYFGTVVIGVVAAMITVPLAFCTLGLSTIALLPGLLLLAAWPIIHAVHGLILSLTDSWDEPIGTFGLGDKLFGNVHAEPSAAAAYHAAPSSRHAATPPASGTTPPSPWDEPGQTIDAPVEEASWRQE